MKAAARSRNPDPRIRGGPREGSWDHEGYAIKVLDRFNTNRLSGTLLRRSCNARKGFERSPPGLQGCAFRGLLTEVHEPTRFPKACPSTGLGGGVESRADAAGSLVVSLDRRIGAVVGGLGGLLR